MRFILTLIILCIFQFSFSQNWSPLVIGKTSNFQLSNSYCITNCIWVTDTIVDIDTSFTLNKIAIKLEENPEILLRNSPQFLKEKMIKKDNGDYIFSGPNNYVIKSYSEFGETWIFDTLNNLTAQTSVVSSEEIFGITDSVKIFQNAKFDINFLRASGFTVGGPIFDTMIAAHLLRTSRGPKRLGLGSLAEFFLGTELPKEEQKSDFSGDLRDGDTVIIRGNERLRPGQTVSIMPD